MRTPIIKINDAKKFLGCVLVYGHFSSLHHGHIRFLRAAKEKGDNLFVALMGDNSATFSQKMQFNQKERASILDHIELIDYIILSDKDGGLLYNDIFSKKKLIPI